MKSPIYERFVFPSGCSLTDQEQIAKDVLIYLFNPCLKYVFAKKNKEAFKQYAFNTCRQTAVLGAYFLHKLLPGYTVRVFEAYCKDVLCGNKVDYIHAFTVATSPAGENILLDISRTVKRLLFHKFNDWDSIYPSVDEYSTMKIISMREIDWELALAEENEYFTGWNIRYLLDVVVNHMYSLLSSSPCDFTSFYRSMYSSFAAFGSFID